jgi:hypothetical protein
LLIPELNCRPTEKIAFPQRPVSLSASTSTNISYTHSPCDSQYTLIPPQLKKTVSFEEADENTVTKKQPEIKDQIEDPSSEKTIENTSNADFNPCTPKINVKFASTDTDDENEIDIAQPMEDVIEQIVIPPPQNTSNSDNMDMSVLSEPDLQYEENMEFAQLLNEGTILSGYVAPGIVWKIKRDFLDFLLHLLSSEKCLVKYYSTKIVCIVL